MLFLWVGTLNKVIGDVREDPSGLKKILNFLMSKKSSFLESQKCSLILSELSHQIVINLELVNLFDLK